MLNARTTALALLIALTAIGCGSKSSTSTGRSPAHGDPRSIFEDELHLRSDPAGTLALLKRLGVTTVRVSVSWASIAPGAKSARRPSGFNGSDPAAYPAASWAVYDAIVRQAQRAGVGLDFSLGPPAPLWATTPGAPTNPFQSWKPSAGEFGQFVHAVGTRYDGNYKPAGAPASLPRVDFWAIWNEPNYGVDLSPQGTDHGRLEVSPLLYRGLLDAAWTALHATGHGGDTILIGETAPRGITTGDSPGNFSGMVPLRFIRALYCVDGSFQRLTGAAASARGCPAGGAASNQFPKAHPALFGATGFADHPYPQGGMPPNLRTPGEPDYADLAAIGNLETTLDRALSAYGRRRQLPIYSTEFGYQTNPPEKIAHTTDPVTAAFYLNWAEYITWRNPRLRSYDQYLLTDPPGANASGGFATGLEFANGVPKATYGAYRLPLYLPVARAHKDQAVEVWGCVRPAAYLGRGAGAGSNVLIQFQSGGAGPFKTLRSAALDDPHGYFDVSVTFPRSGAVRLAWSYPDGQIIYSRRARIGIS
jgi:hypothetical protein